ncbi:hypothetical protein HUM03_005055, partial [Salmonella enterica subsp. enterica serovar Java]|nr:hypothetical protein [Salmonella enterica subsp. enterica serovar Java]
KAEIEGEIGDSHMGVHARMMSQAMRKLKGYINTSRAVVIFINQLRMKIGVMFGNPETTTGGNALKFYASVRMDVRRIGAVRAGKDKEAEVTGSETRVKVVKNKVAPPFRQAEFRIMYGDGIDRAGEVLSLADSCKLVTKTGAWYSYGGERLGNGRDNTLNWLKENPSLLAELEEKVREWYLRPDATPPQSSGKKALSGDDNDETPEALSDAGESA